MMKPVRDPEYLKFIRSLPCAICLTTRYVEAAHVGRRGMGQKSSDRETIPLCMGHHREQHQVGLREFAERYAVNLEALLRALQEKPRITVSPRLQTGVVGMFTPRSYIAAYRDAGFVLWPVSAGLLASIKLAKNLCQEYLIESYFNTQLRDVGRPGGVRRIG